MSCLFFIPGTGGMSTKGQGAVQPGKPLIQKATKAALMSLIANGLW